MTPDNTLVEMLAKRDAEIVALKAQVKALEAACERLLAENDFLLKADRLVCWNPRTGVWEARFEPPK